MFEITKTSISLLLILNSFGWNIAGFSCILIFALISTQMTRVSALVNWKKPYVLAYYFYLIGENKIPIFNKDDDL